MLSSMDFYTLIAIGVVFLALEVFIFSFVVIWFACGFLLIGVVSIFFEFSNLYWQLATVSIVSVLLLLLFRKKFLKRFAKSEKEINDNFFNEVGFGEFKKGKVFYKGTFWQVEANFDIKDLEEGTKVKVVKIKGNSAFIEVV